MWCLHRVSVLLWIFYYLKARYFEKKITSFWNKIFIITNRLHISGFYLCATSLRPCKRKWPRCGYSGWWQKRCKQIDGGYQFMWWHNWHVYWFKQKNDRWKSEIFVKIHYTIKSQCWNISQFNFHSNHHFNFIQLMV